MSEKSPVKYSPETKAAAMAALLAGQAVASIASEYHIPEGTLHSWKNRQKSEPLASLASEKKEEIGDMIVEYLRASLKSLKAQVEHFGNKDWLTTQDADALAVLHGVQTDKAIRLLEAIAAAESPE